MAYCPWRSIDILSYFIISIGKLLHSKAFQGVKYLNFMSQSASPSSTIISNLLQYTKASNNRVKLLYSRTNSDAEKAHKAFHSQYQR